MKKIFYGAILISFSILFRTLWHLAPNVEFVTAASLLASFYLGKRYAVLVPFISIVASDLIIGNSNIYLFTWTGFLIIGVLAIIFEKLRKIKNLAGVKKIALGLSFGLVSSLWFYLFTNFGVWFLDSWGMYPKTLTGLISCYIAGIPFLQLNLIGNMVFIPLSLFTAEKIRILNLSSKKKFFRLE